MSLPAPTIVIFDMDGTTVRHTNPRLLHALEFLDDLSYKLSGFFYWLFERRAQGPIYEDWEIYHARKKPRLLVHKAMHKVRRKDIGQIVEPCPGIYTVLGLLKKHDLPLALASNGLGKGYGHDVLNEFGLDQYFSATIFREDIRKSKPKPDALLVALETLGTPLTAQDTVWYIGDRRKDITAALAARDHVPCTITPIAYGLHASIAVLEKGLPPEHILMSWYDIYRVLEKLLGTPKNNATESEAVHTPKSLNHQG